MTRKTVTLIAITILVVGLIVTGVIGCAPAVVTEGVTEETTTLTDIAQAIKDGEIDVGTEPGLVPGQRYHRIHNVVLGLDCNTCHTGEPDTIQTVFEGQDVSSQAPWPVDKRPCLGCHRAGVGEDLYDLGRP